MPAAVTAGTRNHPAYRDRDRDRDRDRGYKPRKKKSSFLTDLFEG